MKKKQKNLSGIVICDSITMSVKKKTPDLRRLESAAIAVAGFVSVMATLLGMYDFSYRGTSVILAAIFFSAVYIAFAFMGNKGLALTGGSLAVFAVAAYRFAKPITKGFKYVYNVYYCKAMSTEIKYYKFLSPEKEEYYTTVFLIFCVWLLALIIYTFTISRPNPVIILAATFPLIEFGLYYGVSASVFWGIMVVAYWLALWAVCNIDLGEYYGGSGGFVRKGNAFFPKRRMRLKVTEKCALMILVSLSSVALCSMAVMKLTGYQRSESLNQKRADIKAAVSSFTFDDLASSISSVTEAFGFTFSYEDHRLGTIDHIQYKNVTDLAVTFDKKYEGAIYLKGYAGALYDNNEWTELPGNVYSGAKELFGDFEKYGLYPQDFPSVLSDGAFSDNPDITVWLEAKRKKNKSFAPYGTENYGNMEYRYDTTVSSKKNGQSVYSYKFAGVDALNISSALAEKSRNIFSVSSIADSEWQQKISEYCSAHELYSYGDFFSVDSELSQKLVSQDVMYNNGAMIMAALLENSYRSFVYENYLQVPESRDMDEVRAQFADILELSASASAASEKLEILSQIRERISSMTEYTLAPGKTPSNRDFVNYFLLENKKGYCTHYATAGVLLARMAGIPARYATGYIVVGDDFSGSAKKNDGSYVIELPDNRSHAWAEIYLDGFGWVPFEFTTGYSNMSIDTSAQETTVTTAVSSQQSVTTAATPAASSDVSRASSSSSGKSPSTSVSTPNVTTAPNGGANGNGGGSSELNLSRSQKIALFSAAALIIAVLLIYLRRFIIISSRRKRFTQGPAAERVACIYSYTERLLALLDIRRGNMQYTGFADYAEEILAGRYFAPGSFSELMNSALESSFGDAPVPAAAADKAKAFAEALGRKIYEKSGFFAKIHMKFILALI